MNTTPTHSASARPLWSLPVLLGTLALGCDEGQAGRGVPPWVDAPTADNPDGHDHPSVPAEQPTGLDARFEAAASNHDVPMPLLQALSWVETQWQMVEGHEEHDSRPAAFGLMGLRGDALSEAAALAGVSTQDAKFDAMANIDAAAALLSAMADEFGIEDRNDIGAWAEVVAEYSGIEEALEASMFVHREVYPTMREGVVAYTVDGELQGELVAVDAWPSVGVPPPLPALQSGPDYAGSLWRPSPNHSSRGSGSSAAAKFIVIHTCEGSYSGCWSWLKNSGSGVSAHYVVNNTGNEITQLVRENRKAWHISANYDCNKNAGVSCTLNGIGSNKFTVGIEHAGYSNQASWDDGLIDASARLVCDISKEHGIPIDANHVFGHGKMQPWNRNDPGPNWPWAEYLALANSYCSDGGGPVDPEPDGGGDEPGGDDPGGGGGGVEPGDDFQPIIVDSNNTNNDATVGYISVSSQWTSSASTPGYHGTGYWYASAKSTSDPAAFWFYLPVAAEHTVEAWWTVGNDRSPAAPFLIMNAAGGLLETVTKDQRTGGNAWNNLGTYNFPAGWNRVMLSRWAAGGGVVIADAVRIK